MLIEGDEARVAFGVHMFGSVQVGGGSGAACCGGLGRLRVVVADELLAW